MTGYRHAGATIALALALVAWPVASLAQTAAQPPAAPQAAAKPAPAKGKATKAEAGGQAKVDPAQRQAMVDQGVASYNAGKHDLAIQQLSAALSGGKLPSVQMARALYYRGAAYRKQSKPALAISDLTSALWLKGGLAEADRADAMAQRAAAYREAGLPDQGDAAAGAAKTASAAKAAEAAKSASAAPERASPPPKASAPLQTSSINPSPPASASSQPVLSAVPAPSPQANPAPSSSGIGGFFSNLFGGGPVATGAPAQPANPGSGGDQLTSSWSHSTEVRKPSSTQPARTAAVAPPVAVPGAAAPAAAPPAPTKADGRFLLQVAAVRSRDEAQAVAQRVQTQHPAEMAGRQATIDEAVIGNMGTLYRVRIGPFADANEPRALCGKLRASGLDCLIVGN
jgi:hypothetical protein